jgi:sec-independent protein translocase protein TatC
MLGFLTKSNKTSKDHTDNPEAEMDLFDHLDELRTRIFRMILYIIAGMGLAWSFSKYVYNFLLAPLQSALGTENTTVMSDIMQGFYLTMQLSMIVGLIIAAPFILGELWGFIKPALTPEEQRPVRYLTPFAALLFFAGVGVSYISLPIIYSWMTSFLPDGTQLLQQVQQAIIFAAKMMLGCGLLFELPVLLLFLSRIGVINEKMLLTYWRHAVVLIFLLAAVFTPSPDPISMMMMALPLTILYGLSILLVRSFSKGSNGDGKQMSTATMISVCLAPLVIIGISLYWWSGHHTIKPKSDITYNINTTTRDVAALKKEIEDLKAKPATPAPIVDSSLKAQLDAQKAEIAELKKELSDLKEKLKPIIEATPMPVSTPNPEQTSRLR